MPTHGLRLQAYQLLALAVNAHDEGRPADAYDLTAKAMEHLEDAMSVEKLRRVAARPSESPSAAVAGLTARRVGPSHP
jgi:hypothetical protein